MPEIKIKHVVSCSTEDTTHKADNLLSSDTYRKWKSARPGEKNTSVILQFEKEEQVHSIDIGNEGSAFVEVLVGNSSSAGRDQDYEVLLVTSSFMSPTESRNGTNTNRVRFFGPNQLQKATAQEKKWDRVKIVCSQPYSKNIAYGLAFVTFHSPPDKNDPNPTSSPKLTKLGQFRVKEESSTPSNLQPGGLFFNRDSATKSSPSVKVSPQSQRVTYAAATLQATSTAQSSSQASSTSASPQTPVKRKFEFTKERQSTPAPPPPKKSPTVSPEIKNTTPKSKPSPSSMSTAVKAPPAQKSSEKILESKPKSKQAKSQQVPLNKIMEGVVFVLSGFQNPFRGELREKSLNMGAKYRPDWTPDSTHLICAFANTPKYSQVKSAGGIIVRKEWVLDCHKRKQKLPYKRYLMDGAESSSESEMDVDDDSEDEVNIKTPVKQERAVSSKKTPEKRNGDDDEYAGSTDLDEAGNDNESAADTEDELQRMVKERKGPTDMVTVKGEDPYQASTDENTDAEAEEDHGVPDLPDFLNGKHFFLYGKFPASERRLLFRYIVAFNGVIEDYMTETVQFVVTCEGWHDSFEDALVENDHLNFVKPAWIYAINERQKMLPYQPYSVVPAV